ncbi:MAG TPA: class I SAM-dependent methyltransferase [Ignavibacteriaceae bacterium]|nr:class I SAM-dependent methyltransferase [Ignavibacteriaceae bacterium]
MMSKKYRHPLPFDTNFFQKEKLNSINYSVKETFEKIYRSNHWGDANSASGNGSNDNQTKTLATELPKLFAKLNIDILLDLPCGDFNWLNKLELPIKKYIGGDIVPEIIQRNINLYRTPSRDFYELNLITDKLPNCDAILCRDCLVHLSNDDIIKSITNIRRSSAKYFISTTFPECTENLDIITGDWRVINLEIAPFNLPKPIFLLNENCTEGEGTYTDKSLAVWSIDDL